MAKVDGNHKEIVEALRKAGCSVLDMSRVGGGAPDLAVGRNGRNYFLEIKNGDNKPPSACKLTKDQEQWHFAWSGQVAVVHNAQDAITVINSAQRGLE